MWSLLMYVVHPNRDRKSQPETYIVLVVLLISIFIKAKNMDRNYWFASVFYSLLSSNWLLHLKVFKAVLWCMWFNFIHIMYHNFSSLTCVIFTWTLINRTVSSWTCNILHVFERQLLRPQASHQRDCSVHCPRVRQ